MSLLNKSISTGIASCIIVLAFALPSAAAPELLIVRLCSGKRLLLGSKQKSGFVVSSWHFGRFSGTERSRRGVWQVVEAHFC